MLILVSIFAVMFFALTQIVHIILKYLDESMEGTIDMDDVEDHEIM